MPILNFSAEVKTLYGPREVLLPSLLLLLSINNFHTHVFADAIPEAGKGEDKNFFCLIKLGLKFLIDSK